MTAFGMPPLDRESLIRLGLLEARSRVLDLAAFLDRVQRTAAADDPLGDPRVQAIVAAVRLLADGQPERARRVLELWSDPTMQPVPHADGKAARGMHLPGA
ncbi:MAG: hypothetical protein ACO32J_01305 [Phycisphaerales bacterium]